MAGNDLFVGAPHISSLVGDLLAKSSSHITVPAFQRAYVWQAQRATDLTCDLWSASEVEEGQYFLGSIVMVPPPTARAHSLLVDGQQRITTVSLIVRAALQICRDDRYREAMEALDDEAAGAAPTEVLRASLEFPPRGTRRPVPKLDLQQGWGDANVREGGLGAQITERRLNHNHRPPPTHVHCTLRSCRKRGPPSSVAN